MENTTTIKILNKVILENKDDLNEAKNQLNKRYKIGHHIIAAALGVDSEQHKAIEFWKYRIKTLKNLILVHTDILSKIN
jgi:lambda repressor-like predicted transcriptional regulator